MGMDMFATHREYLTVSRLNAQTQYLRDLPRRRIGFDAERSSCDLYMLNTPAYNGSEPGSCDFGWNGLMQRFFTGIIQTPSAASPSFDRSVKLVDKLGLLIQNSFESDITWTSRAFDDAVTDVLTGVGVDAADIAFIYDPGITLGGTYDIVIKTSESPAEVFRQLMDYGGTKAIVYPNGKIYVLDISGIPTASPAKLSDGTAMIYAYGATGVELPIIDSSWVLETIENPVVSVTVTGPLRSDGATPTGIASITATGRPWSQYYRFLQDTTTANTIADRELSRRAVPRRVVQFQADSNLEIMPGHTIGFRDTTLGISSTTVAFVWSVAVDGPTMTVSLLLGAHIIDGYNPLEPPIAVPTIITIEKQPVIIAGNTVTRYFVQMDGSASSDPDGYIVGYDWTATGATPSSSTLVNPLFVYATLDGSQQITLQVTDDDAQTNSVTITLPASTDDSVVRRQLIIAEGSNGLAFVDDGENFQQFTRSGRSCTAVPAINDQGDLLSGWDDGAIYKINDEYTAIEAVVTLAGGQINALWRNEGDPNNVLAGAGAKLHTSIDGTSFALKQTFAATINDLQNSPSNVNEIRVATGAYLKLSFDGGTTFSDVITGAAGTTARMIATAPWGHACVFTGGSSPTHAIKFEESYTVDWSAVASPPNALRTITALLDQEGFVVGDATGNFYKLLWDGSGFDATDIGTISGTPSIDDGIRDGTLPGLHFYATDGGTKKLTNLTTIWDVKANASLQIGYGKIGAYIPPATIELIVPTFGVAGRGVWHYVPASGWTLKATGLPASSWYGRWIAANPFDPDEWLLLINTSNSDTFIRGATVLCADSTTSPLWRTTDAGANWSVATIDATGLLGSSIDEMTIKQVEFSTATDGNWFLVGYRTGFPAVTVRGIVWRGTGTASSAPVIDTGWSQVTWGVAGTGDDVVVYEFDSPGAGTGGRLGLNTNGGSSITIVLSQIGRYYHIERAAGLLPTLFGANQGTTSLDPIPADLSKLLYMKDYRNGVSFSYVLTSDSSFVYWITSTADGSAYCGGDTASDTRRSTVRKFSDFLYGGAAGSSSTQSNVTTALTLPETVGYIRSDRQTRTYIAARIVRTTGTGAGAKDLWIFDGTTWSRLAGPASAGDADLANRVEVIGRGGA